MQKNISNKFNRRILCILILSILTYTTFSILPQTMNKSYATIYTYTANSNDLPTNFEEKYPNYKTLINTLVLEHPNWTFKLLETDLDWNTVLNYESKHGKSLVQPGYYTSEWGCSCDVVYDDPWKCASRAAVEYMMDPRNFLNSYDIFQFQDLTSSNGDRNAVASMISGTFMDSDTHRDECIQAIMEAAEKYSISPYFITSKIIQEQSSSGSELSSGEGYDVNNDGVKEYVGYYNLFNIGAYPTDDASTIENGLKKAQNNGWDSMYKSILSGAEFIRSSYMSVEQTTVYFQKYNVVNRNNLYGNQYMTNVWGAYSEGKIMRSKYIRYGISESKFTFTIPLYTGMPEMNGELVYVNANPSLKLKAGPSSSSSHLLSIDLSTIVLRIEKATQKVDGYYWDKVITPYGIGYMARNAYDDSKQYLVPLTLVPPTDTTIDTTKNNNYTEPDNNNIIYTEPNTTVNKLKEKYTNAIILNKNGEEITDDTLIGTGAKIKIDGEEKYTIVKMGDVNGDGIITPADYVKIRNHIMELTTLSNSYLSAADINKDGVITPADYVKVRNHIMGSSEISL